MEEVYTYLNKLGLDYVRHDHPAVFTVEQANQIRIGDNFGETKNLFLRNNKGNRHFLITLGASKRISLKDLSEELGVKKLSFASETRLEKYLGLTPGSVSPFGLINDTENVVTFVIDCDLFKCDKLGFHPNINTQTLVMETKEFKRYLESLKNEIIELDCHSL